MFCIFIKMKTFGIFRTMGKKEFGLKLEKRDLAVLTNEYLYKSEISRRMKLASLTVKTPGGSVG